MLSPVQHLLAQVRENDLFALQAPEVRLDLLIAHVVARLLLEEAALAQKKVGPAGMAYKEIGPGRVARVEKGLSSIGDFKRQRDVANLVRHAERENLDSSHEAVFFRLEDVKFRRRRIARLGGVAKHHLEQGADSLLGSARPGDMEGPCARALVEVLEKEEGQPAAVVAVQVAQKNGIEARGIEALALHGEKRGRAAIEKEKPVPGVDEVGAVVSSAAAKGVATP